MQIISVFLSCYGDGLRKGEGGLKIIESAAFFSIDCWSNLRFFYFWCHFWDLGFLPVSVWYFAWFIQEQLCHTFISIKGYRLATHQCLCANDWDRSNVCQFLSQTELIWYLTFTCLNLFLPDIYVLKQPLEHLQYFVLFNDLFSPQPDLLGYCVPYLCFGSNKPTGFLFDDLCNDCQLILWFCYESSATLLADVSLVEPTMHFRGIIFFSVDKLRLACCLLSFSKIRSFTIWPTLAIFLLTLTNCKLLWSDRAKNHFTWLISNENKTDRLPSHRHTPRMIPERKTSPPICPSNHQHMPEHLIFYQTFFHNWRSALTVEFSK